MISASFTCANKELRSVINQLVKLVPAPMLKRTSIEIRIQPSHVSFHAPGVERKLVCVTTGMGSFTLSLPYFRQLVIDNRKQDFHADFKDNEMNVGGVLTKGIFSPLQATHPEMRPTLDLPLNFRDLDLLRLHWQGNDFDKAILNADKLIEVAEKRLHDNLDRAFERLKIYDITKEEILQWIRAKAMKPRGAVDF